MRFSLNRFLAVTAFIATGKFITFVVLLSSFKKYNDYNFSSLLDFEFENEFEREFIVSLAWLTTFFIAVMIKLYKKRRLKVQTEGKNEKKQA